MTPEEKEELDKVVYGTGILEEPEPTPDYSLKYGDKEPVVKQRDIPKDPNPTPGQMNIKFRGKEDLNLDWIYSPGAMKISHVRQFVNANAEENERFLTQVIANEEEQAVVPGIRKPTQLEFTEASDKDRTAMRRDWYRSNALAVGYVNKMLATVKRSTLDNGIKVLASAAVSEFKDIFRQDSSILHGQKAIRKVQELEGDLTFEQKRVIEEEGYSAESYDDTKGVVTSGVGQTGEFIGKSFKETFNILEQELITMLPSYPEQPQEVRAELMQAMYRGDIQQSPKFRELFNAGKYKEAAKEFLRHEEFKTTKSKGIKNRLAAVAKAVSSLETGES